MKKIILNCLLLNFFKLISSSPTLLIKIPTRQRPTQFFNILDNYYQNLSGENNCAFLISCDIDDLSMNNPHIIEKLKTYSNLYFYFSNSKNKIEAYNADIEKHLDFDVLLVTSDDTKPTKNFDQKIVNLMLTHFPDFDGVINFNDGHVKNDLNTLPVIGKKFYARFGYIYNPLYKSMFCDNELTEISKLLKREFYTDEIIIEHVHPSWNPKITFDELYKKNDKFLLEDLIIYKKRILENFK